jgi:hypothetical protein
MPAKKEMISPYVLQTARQSRTELFFLLRPTHVSVALFYMSSITQRFRKGKVFLMDLAGYLLAV